MTQLIAWFSRNTIAANLLMLAILLGGIFAVQYIDKEFFPKADPSSVEISIAYPGAAPVNVEEQICIRVEQALDGLSGVDRITTKAKKNRCEIDVEVADNYSIGALYDDVKNRVDSLNTLPVDAEKPQVTQPLRTHDMMEIVLEGEVSEKVLKIHADKIKRELEQLKYVSTVNVQGQRDYEITIELDRSALLRHQLSFNQVRQAVSNNSIDSPLGTIRSNQGDILLQTRQEADDIEKLANIIVLKSPDGGVVKLGDIATIKDDFTQDYSIISRFNKTPALFLEVQVTGDPDVLKTKQEVSAYLSAKQQELPESLTVSVWHDFSLSFKDRIRTLLKNGASGLLLVFVVLMLFLRPLLALWVCIGIFIAFLGTLWLMPMLDASLNMISLFAFLMILGIVVDDAIIVGESVYAEQQAHGAGTDSAIRGTQRVYKPVLFAVASTMLVFIPMLFLPGESAKASQAIPTVVLLTLAFSLIESLFILPSHLADMPPEGYFKHPLIQKFDRLRGFFAAQLARFVSQIYRPLLSLALRHYSSAIASFVVAMVLSISIFAGGWMTFSFLPNVTTDYIILQITLPQGEPEQLTQDITYRIENASEQVQQQALFKDSDTSHIWGYSVRGWENNIYGAMGINREFKQTISSPELIDMWREAIGPIPEAEDMVFFYQISDQGKPLEYQLSSESNQSLNEASQLLQQHLAAFAGVFDVRDSLQTPRSEIELALKPSSEFGAWDMNLLTQQVRSAFYGSEIKRIPRDGEDIRIMLKLAADQRGQYESIVNLPVRDSNGQQASLGAISDIDYVPALQDITRTDKKRSLKVTADLKPDTSDAIEISNSVIGEFAAALKQTHPDVEVALKGQEEERRDFMAAWGIYFLQALLAIYAMMAIAFRSYWQPVIILTAIPFGVMGAIFGHLIMNYHISIFSFLGVMACAGVVVNDNLVLIDRINQLRSQGVEIFDAVLQGGIDRFRPIILTSMTTFIGLLPIMSETSLQAQFLIPMVISLAYGVLFATTVTLILVPCLYYLGERFKVKLSHVLHLDRDNYA